MLNAFPLLVAGLMPVGLPAAPNARPTPSTACPAETSTDEGKAVELQTRDQLTLGATYFAPTKPGRHPGVVLVHDAGSDRSQLAELADYLRRRGMAVLTIDLRGHGGSATDDLAWAKLSDERSQASLWSFAAGDVRTAVDWLRGQQTVHSARVGVVGVGAGASLAVAEALDDRDTSAVAMISPAADNHGFNLPRNLSDLAGLPTLILTGKDGRNEADRLASAANSANGGHEYVMVSTLRSDTGGVMQDKRLGTELAKWLKDTLDPSN